MIKYSDLVKKTMPPEKKASAAKCVVGHYLVRPISNIISIPLIEKNVRPTSVTIFSAFFPLLAMMAFALLPRDIGFCIGWLSILIWNILDGVDGNIARYNERCSRSGELWDATVGWMAVIAFYTGMGYVASSGAGRLNVLCAADDSWYITLGWLSAMCWMFPRLVMQKKNVLMGQTSVRSVKDRANYGLLKLLFFNITSVNGLASVLFLVAYLVDLVGICMIGYTVISLAVCAGSLFSLLFKEIHDE